MFWLALLASSTFIHAFQVARPLPVHHPVVANAGVRWTLQSTAAAAAPTLKNTRSCLAMNRCDVYADTVLKQPRWGGPVLGPIVRYLNSCFIGVIFTVVLRVLNRFKAFHKERLIHQIFRREKGRGMLTVSNHMSVADDPGLFAALIPWWRVSPRRLRWVLCTEDVFFAVRGHTVFCRG